jgi:hypothetical protein
MDPKVYKHRLAILAWGRMGLGVIAGVLSGSMGFISSPIGLNENAYYGAYLGVLFYFLSYYWAKYSVLKGIDPKNKNKLITQGIGTFIMIFLFTWIVYNTGVYIYDWPHF